MSVDPKRWMFYNCVKDKAWIVYHKIAEITQESRYEAVGDFVGPVPPLNENSTIIYVHAIEMTEEKLVTIVESTDGFYLIKNHKEKGETEEDSNLVSIINYHPRLKDLIAGISRSTKNYLGIKKVKNMKLTQDQRRLSRLPYDYGHPNANRASMLREHLSDNKGILNLQYNFSITSTDLQAFSPGEGVKPAHTLMLHTNFNIKDFDWCQSSWAQGLVKVELANLVHFIDASLEKLLDELPNLKQLHIHHCPRITIRCLKGLLKKDQLEIIALNYSGMVCQPNAYSALIGEEEWDLMGNRSVQTLLINSTNMSLDLIHDIKRTCHSLKTLILDNKVYNQFRQALANDGDKTNKPLNVVSTNKHGVTVGRDCLLQGLLRQNFQRPFSDSMARIIEQTRAREAEGLSSDSDTDSSD